ncbi:hypothetical protein MVES1_001048 [Malassezia vespertilionis]|uniref:TAFII55 protein conserved region domain-containing protein n=1 Tax=Malassezia vespertilionis TaxID=2020962 RepID=A0A2N1JEZ3_9BASI|nr:uncharacterized protein MVES1_001048 [Malassezia vespertilionis]PKI85119.1 hypothetical protein MVES_000988 [Malassezia vespertilionis]WFD05715.1 hypothetical protein MVES1_001048 [Malassezia vespertilionis]
MDAEPKPRARERSGRPQFRKPRVRLNFSRNMAGATTGNDGPKTKAYMQGYDRELDSEDEDAGEGMAFEEQMILRLPEGPGVDGELDELRREIRKRGTFPPNLWFKFKDSRRAIFHIGSQLYSAKIVDLPCIIESHKTLDSKQVFKIADISQMLLVQRPLSSEAEATGSQTNRATGSAKFNLDDYIYPHGITPPLNWARKRRFRKRIHNQSIEHVEKEVDTLLNDDRRAERVDYEFVDPAEADILEQEIANAKLGGEMLGADDGSSQQDSENDDSDDDDTRIADGEGMDDENVDQDLAAELDAALAREHGDGDSISGSDNDQGPSDDEQSRRDSDLEDLWDDDDADEDNDDTVAVGAAEEDKDDDDGEEEAERRVRESQLEAESREIEVLIRRKQQDVDSTMNTLIKGRHQQALRKLQVEHDLKKKHLNDIRQLRRTIREERAAEAKARLEKAKEAAQATAVAGPSEETDEAADASAKQGTTEPSNSS